MPYLIFQLIHLLKPVSVTFGLAGRRDKLSMQCTGGGIERQTAEK